MSQNLNFFIAKLSAPIGRLNLDRRVLNTLRRLRLPTISQIIAVGKHDILLMRSVGPSTVDQLYHALAEYLGVSEDILEGEEMRQVALAVPERPWEPLSMPIAVLDLSDTVFLLLKKAGVLEIEQLIRFRANHYAGHGQFGVRESQEIDRALSSYLKFLNETETWQINIPRAHEIDQANTLSITPGLGAALDSLGLDERAWLVIEYRTIRLSTLREIGVEIGVSRERVRQIIRQVNKKIQHKLGFLLDYCDYFEERAELIRQKVNTEELALSALIDEFKYQLAGSNFAATKEDLERFIMVIRFLVISNRPWVQDTFEVKRKGFTVFICLVEPPIKKYITKEKKKRTGYRELAYMVLAEASGPLQWREIEERARKLNKKERFETRSLYDALISHKNLFISDGQGTYKLSKVLDPLPDLPPFGDHE